MAQLKEIMVLKPESLGLGTRKRLLGFFPVGSETLAIIYPLSLMILGNIPSTATFGRLKAARFCRFHPRLRPSLHKIKEKRPRSD
jgi:hypothetical protein